MYAMFPCFQDFTNSMQGSVANYWFVLPGTWRVESLRKKYGTQELRCWERVINSLTLFSCNLSWSEFVINDLITFHWKWWMRQQFQCGLLSRTIEFVITSCCLCRLTDYSDHLLWHEFLFIPSFTDPVTSEVHACWMIIISSFRYTSPQFTPGLV